VRTATRKHILWIGLSAALTLFTWTGLVPDVIAQIDTSGESNPSIGQSISQGFKKRAAKVGEVFKPNKPPTPTNDPLSLSSDAKPSPRLFVALARLHEEEGRLSSAADHYEKALDLDANYPGALLGLAQLQEKLGHPLEAVKIYERAAKLNPENASVANNRGLFYAKRKQYDESLESLEKAIRLKPKDAKYRHNLALVLVQMGRNDEALRHLRAVHGEAVAHYNLGFLLKTKGDPQAAAVHFRRAATVDPAMRPARYWLAELQTTQRQKTQPTARQRAPAQPMPSAPVQTRMAAPPVTQPLPAATPRVPPHVADRSSHPSPQVRVMPPPPRRAPPLPDSSSPTLREPQDSHGTAPLPPAMSGPYAPTPEASQLPPRSSMPPLPANTRRPAPVKRLPSIN